MWSCVLDISCLSSEVLWHGPDPKLSDWFLRRGLSTHHLPLLRQPDHRREPRWGLQAHKWKDQQCEVSVLGPPRAITRTSFCVLYVLVSNMFCFLFIIFILCFSDVFSISVACLNLKHVFAFFLSMTVLFLTEMIPQMFVVGGVVFCGLEFDPVGMRRLLGIFQCWLEGWHPWICGLPAPLPTLLSLAALAVWVWVDVPFLLITYMIWVTYADVKTKRT